MKRTAHPRIFTVAAFVLVALIWGSTWLVIKDQISVVPAGWSITWRFALATVGMFVLAFVRGDALRLDAAGMHLAFWVGLLQFCLNFQFVYRAEAHLTSGLVAVMFALLLVPNAVMARLFLGAVVSRRFVVGSLVALAGIGLLMLREYRFAALSVNVGMGVGLTLCALLSASAANVLQASDVAKRQAVVPMIAWAMLWGTCADAVVSWVIYGAPVFDPRPAYLAGVGYLAIIGSVVTFPLYFGLIRQIGAGRAAYNGVMVPVIAMGLSTLFEGYVWTGLAAGGAGLAMVGLVIALSG
ncbi:MAG: hypothetical protein RLY97_56 [Pseudomonadota bacterium]